MGYEVLDSRGEATNRPGDASPAAVDVMDLGALPHPVDEPPPSVWPVVRQRLTVAVVSVIKAPTTAKRVALLVVAALAIGAVVSGVVVRRHEEDQQRQAQNAVLSVGAIVSNFSPTNSGAVTTAAVTADLTNYGPVPVRVVTTPGDPKAGRSVQMLSSSPDVAPGSTARVSLGVPVDCQGQGGDPTFTVPVLTGDQRRHEVPVELNLGEMSVRSAICNDGNGDVQASVVGSIARPLLRLKNDSAGTKVFVVRDGQGPVARDGPLVTITTLPATPVDVPSGQSMDLRLLVTLRECPRDLSAITTGVYLTIDASSNDGSLTSGMGVDIGALVGAAVAVARCTER